MGAFYTKLRYVGDEDRLKPGPWDWTVVEIETGQEMCREAPTHGEAELQARAAVHAFEALA